VNVKNNNNNNTKNNNILRMLCCSHPLALAPTRMDILCSLQINLTISKTLYSHSHNWKWISLFHSRTAIIIIRIIISSRLTAMFLLFLIHNRVQHSSKSNPNWHVTCNRCKSNLQLSLKQLRIDKPVVFLYFPPILYEDNLADSISLLVNPFFCVCLFIMFLAMCSY